MEIKLGQIWKSPRGFTSEIIENTTCSCGSCPEDWLLKIIDPGNTELKINSTFYLESSKLYDFWTLVSTSTHR